MELNTLPYGPKGSKNDTLLKGFISEAFYTELGKIDRFKAISALNDQACMHAITKEDIFS
jgi:hypothetical protein